LHQRPTQPSPTRQAPPDTGAAHRCRPERAQAAVALLLAVLLGIIAGCKSDVPDFEDVPPADELYAEGLKILAGEDRRWLFFLPPNYDKAIETFQSIIDNYPYSEFETKAQLKIADAYYDDERWDEALSYYRDFADLHPQHERVPYTILRSALCHYNQVEAVNRDQTSTHESIRYLDLLLKSYPYSSEAREAEVLLLELRTLLALNTMKIGDFYLDRTQWPSAAARYRIVLNEYPGLGLDADALYKLGYCYENMRRRDEALRLYHVVLENYRGTRAARNAAARIAKAG